MNNLFETKWLETKKALCEGRDMRSKGKKTMEWITPFEHREPDYLRIIKDIVDGV